MKSGSSSYRNVLLATLYNHIKLQSIVFNTYNYIFWFFSRLQYLQIMSNLFRFVVFFIALARQDTTLIVTRTITRIKWYQTYNLRIKSIICKRSLGVFDRVKFHATNIHIYLYGQDGHPCYQLTNIKNSIADMYLHIRQYACLFYYRNIYE